MTISIEAEKAFDEIQYLLIKKKILQNISIKGTYLSIAQC